MDKRTNIATNATTNSITRLDIRYLLEDDSLLNSKDETKIRSINEGKNDIFFEKKPITTGTNLQLES